MIAAGPISVVLADDHHIVRRGLRALLASESGIQVVGEAADGLEAVAVVERLRPDVLVLDLMMPGINGLEVTRQVQHRASSTHVVMLSMYGDEGYLLEALRNGALAYVLKDADPRELLIAVREAAAGQRYLSPPFSERTVAAYLEKARTSAPEGYETLTTREREVLHLVAEGHTNTQIGERLGISPRTADTHRTNLMRKLNLHSQGELVRFALQRGIIALDGPPRVGAEPAV
jgi:two-component system, NarL family, response regulator NreC